MDVFEGFDINTLTLQKPKLGLRRRGPRMANEEARAKEVIAVLMPNFLSSLFKQRWSAIKCRTLERFRITTLGADELTLQQQID